MGVPHTEQRRSAAPAVVDDAGVQVDRAAAPDEGVAQAVGAQSRVAVPAAGLRADRLAGN